MKDTSADIMKDTSADMWKSVLKGDIKEIECAPELCSRAIWFISTLALALGYENQTLHAHSHDDADWIIEILPNSIIDGVYTGEGQWFSIRFRVNSKGQACMIVTRVGPDMVGFEAGPFGVSDILKALTDLLPVANNNLEGVGHGI